MAGDYKSYSIRTGLIIALCAFWILLPQVLHLNMAYLQVDCSLTRARRLQQTLMWPFPKGRDEVHYNWSLMDRSLLQKIQNTSTKRSTTCNQNSFAKNQQKVHIIPRGYLQVYKLQQMQKIRQAATLCNSHPACDERCEG